MKLVRWIACLALLGAPRATSAREGMFLLDKLPEGGLRQSGLKLAPAQLLARSRAVVQVASGGTGSFVSPRGLLVTNHHVAYRCLAALGARPEHLGLLERGHVARNAAAELPCPGYDLLIVKEVRDVRQAVLQAVKPGTGWARRFEAIRLRKEELVAACEKEAAPQNEGPPICEVASLDGGVSYTRSVYRRIRDVRLVYAPPEALGKFGGDVDNWMFPRHTADFTFLRAYVGPGGAAAPYAKDNVPLATPQHLVVSRGGVRAGSLVAVIGFPARTSRHAHSTRVRFYRDEQLPTTTALMQGLIGVVVAERAADEDARRKYAALESGAQNAFKYYQLSARGFARYHTLERKLEGEQALRGRLDAAGQRRFDELGAKMKQVLDRYRPAHRRLALLSSLAGFGCSTVRAAYDLARWGREKAKPDRMRKEDRYKEKNVYRLREAAERLDKEVRPATEKALLLYFLRAGQQLGAAQPRLIGKLLRWADAERRRGARKNEDRQAGSGGADPLARAVELLYARTRLVAPADDAAAVRSATQLRLQLFDAPSATVAGHDDALLRFGRDLEAELTALKEGPYKELEQHLGATLHPAWVEEVLRPVYPDANSTVRLSYGSVRDYRATETGKTHRYLSTLGGLLAKDKGAAPFLVPAALKAAAPTRAQSPFADRALRDVPVNFTATLDTTGGNSGSPVLDDGGRLVGLLFDGTPESILSDWQFLEGEQRAICLDIRFALYLAALDKNQRLLLELGVVR